MLKISNTRTAAQLYLVTLQKNKFSNDNPWHLLLSLYQLVIFCCFTATQHNVFVVLLYFSVFFQNKILIKMLTWWDIIHWTLNKEWLFKHHEYKKTHKKGERGKDLAGNLWILLLWKSREIIQKEKGKKGGSLMTHCLMFLLRS